MWPFGYYRLFHPETPCAWHKVRILRETNKAVLVDNGGKTWIPKSRINKIRLRNNIFEIYIKKGIVA